MSTDDEDERVEPAAEPDKPDGSKKSRKVRAAAARVELEEGDNAAADQEDPAADTGTQIKAQAAPRTETFTGDAAPETRSLVDVLRFKRARHKRRR